MNAVIKPPLLPVDAKGIPASMMDQPRWAPWRAEWNPEANGGAGKYEKIPHRSDRPEHGLSNKDGRGWVPFHRAMQVYLANPGKFAGVGYLMTGKHGVTGVDLDHCRDPATGEIAPWAAEVAAKLDSYTEVSPSGTGLHVMVAADVDRDWTNHERGIEVYGGNDARFLAITGVRVPGSPAEVRAPRGGVLDTLAARWRRELTTAQIHDLRLPDLIPDCLLPEIEELDLPTHARNFLSDGPEPGDRSRQLFATSIALHQAGLKREEVLSILEANEHAMEVALDHRRQDYDKALRYLWKDHCQNGAARAEGFRQLALDEFDELEAPPVGGDEQAAPAEPQVPGIADDFENLDADEAPQVATPPERDRSAQKAKRFALIAPADYMKRKPTTWLMRDVLPKAGLAVIFGASGSGKTFLTLDLAMCITRGEPWRGKQVAKGRGVYIVAEGAGGFRSRLAAYCQHHGVDPASLDIRFITDAPNLLDKADIRELLVALLSYGPVDFVVIDTYARAMAGANENDAKDVGQAVAHCDAIHRKTGALVILVHHSGKDASSGARGSSVLRAAADVEIEVVRTNQYRAATVTKMKDGQDGQEYQFRLADVEVGRDEDDEPITSCVVEHRENVARRTATGKALTPAQQLVLSTLDTASDLSEGGLHYAELKRLVVDATPRDETKKKDNRHRDVGNAIDALIASGDLASNAEGYVERAEKSNQ